MSYRKALRLNSKRLRKQICKWFCFVLFCLIDLRERICCSTYLFMYWLVP